MSENARIRVLIVDDELLARKKLRRLLSSDAEIEIVGECGSGGEAVITIRDKSPELVFLDVQMPVMDGFQVLEAIEAPLVPLVVFVTAYDQYALRAFEVYALDYLLKPFDRQRFDKALQRAKARIRQERTGKLNEQAIALLTELKAKSSYLGRLVIKAGGRVFFIRIEEIDWIAAEGKYVRVYVRKESYLLREAIGTLESQLDPDKFLRIHRSSIVNIDRIKELQPWFNNEYRVILCDGTQLMLSRSCRKRLSEILGNQL
ncbi:MAG: LytTR family DNA-binding domain-containing protein [Acidobacteriota bacterium]